jgi:hypothetical protein
LLVCNKTLYLCSPKPKGWKAGRRGISSKKCWGVEGAYLRKKPDSKKEIKSFGDLGISITFATLLL